MIKTDFARRAFAITWGIAFVIDLIVGQGPTDDANISRDLIHLIIMSLIALMGLCWPHFDYEDSPKKPVRLMRRFIAANVDLSFLFILILVPICILRGLVLAATGDEFSFATPSDSYGFALIYEIVGVLFCYAVIFFYFLHSLKTGERTLGQRLLGFRIETSDDSALAKRIWLGAFALGFSIFTAAACAHAPPGRYYWDEKSRTRAVSTRTV